MSETESSLKPEFRLGSDYPAPIYPFDIPELMPADEPVFLLRASDPVASLLVRHWADLTELRDQDPDQEDLDGAYDRATEMEVWRDKHL